MGGKGQTMRWPSCEKSEGTPLPARERILALFVKGEGDVDNTVLKREDKLIVKVLD